MTDDKFKPHKSSHVDKEPFINWLRKTHDEIPKDKSTQSEAEIITDRDLDKPIEQLLCDIEETHVKWGRIREELLNKDLSEAKMETKKEEAKDKAVELILYALTRSSSMNAVVALENRKTQDKITAMTDTLKMLTKVLVAIGVVTLAVMLVPMIFPRQTPQPPIYIQCPKDNKETTNNSNNTENLLKKGHIQKNSPSLGR